MRELKAGQVWTPATFDWKKSRRIVRVYTLDGKYPGWMRVEWSRVAGCGPEFDCFAADFHRWIDKNDAFRGPDNATPPADAGAATEGGG